MATNSAVFIPVKVHHQFPMGPPRDLTSDRRFRPVSEPCDSLNVYIRRSFSSTVESRESVSGNHSTRYSSAWKLRRPPVGSVSVRVQKRTCRAYSHPGIEFWTYNHC